VTETSSDRHEQRQTRHLAHQLRGIVPHDERPQTRRQTKDLVEAHGDEVSGVCRQVQRRTGCKLRSVEQHEPAAGRAVSGVDGTRDGVVEPNSTEVALPGVHK
jgi:hypothetical protein